MGLGNYFRSENVVDYAIHGWYVPAYSFSDGTAGSAQRGRSKGIGQALFSINIRYSDYGRCDRHFRVNACISCTNKTVAISIIIIFCYIPTLVYVCAGWTNLNAMDAFKYHIQLVHPVLL